MRVSEVNSLTGHCCESQSRSRLFLIFYWLLEIILLNLFFDFYLIILIEIFIVLVVWTDNNLQ